MSYGNLEPDEHIVDNMVVKADGSVDWLAASGLRHESLITIPTREQTRNYKGLAAALRELANFVEDRGEC